MSSAAARSSLPLVYSCSGCSNLAQLANRLALALDRSALAEMSCIAGLGGDVAPLVNKAQQAQQIIAIDGCPLHCARHCLRRHDLIPTRHYTLTEFGLKKRQHSDCDEASFASVWQQLQQDLLAL